MIKGFGVSLSDVTDVPSTVQDKLRALGITTAEQLVAIAAIESALEPLARHLGVSKTVLSRQVKTATDRLPGRVAAAMTEPYAEALGLGAMEPPTDARYAAVAGPYEAVTNIAALPAAVNHIPRLRPIQNQASRGTCVSFACTALNEDYHRNSPGGVPDLSEQCLYARCKEVDGAPNQEGTWVHVGMDCLVRFGQSTEACEPYNPNPPTNQPGPHNACCATESPQWRLLDKLQLNQNSVADIKAALANGKVVAFSIPVYASWYNSAYVRRYGTITMPIPGEQGVGGHAMLFVGYQDDASAPGGGFLVLRNSWGTTWANSSAYGAGYGTLPYQYMTDQGWEAWTYPTVPPICPVGPQHICPPAPLYPCPVEPQRICPVRPLVLMCPPRPILVCPPRPICPPGPVLTCPPAPMPICPGGPTQPGPRPRPEPYPQAVYYPQAAYPGIGYSQGPYYPTVGYPYAWAAGAPAESPVIYYCFPEEGEAGGCSSYGSGAVAPQPESGCFDPQMQPKE
jgi:hypothetical protein